MSHRDKPSPSPRLVKRPRPGSSCAECRRLKVKCDKKVPCSACARRGCPQLCPGETLAVKELFNTRTQLLSENSQLQERVKDLERIINASFQGGFAAAMPSAAGFPDHPTIPASPSSSLNDLSQWSSQTPFSVNNNLPASTPNIADPFNSQASGPSGSGSSMPISSIQLAEGGGSGTKLTEQRPVTNTGTLVVVPGGRSKFIGPSAMPLWLSEGANNQMDSRPPSPLCSSAAFDAEPSNQSPVSGLLAPAMARTWVEACSNLPTRDDAWFLAESNFRHLAWVGMALSREMFEECFNTIYTVKTVEPQGHSEKSLLFQKLAWVYIVLALGTLVSLELPLEDNSGRLYFEMSQQCLVNGRFLTFSTIIGVHTTTMLARYCSYADMRSGWDLAWQLRGLSSRLLQSMGLHRDGQSWNLSFEDLNLRRRVFWEAFCSDVFLSRCWDRPTCIAADQYDTKLPEDAPIYDICRFKLSILVKEALDVSVSIKPTPYTKVADLSQAISDAEAAIPYDLRCRATVKAMVSRYVNIEAAEAASPEPSRKDVKTAFQQHVLACDYSAAVFLLLRPYFVDALYSYPADPTQSSYAGAYLAVIERSSMLVAMLRSICSLYALMSTRHWQFWTHAFSAAVCMATVCIVTPTSPLVGLAMSELETVISLSQSISTSLPRRGLRQSIEWLLWLHEKAKSRIAESQKGDVGGSSTSEMMNEPSPMENAEEHLNFVGWRTRLIRLGQSNYIPDLLPTALTPTSVPNPFVPMTGSELTESFWNPLWGMPKDPEVNSSTGGLNPAYDGTTTPFALDQAGLDGASVDFLQQLLGAPAGQPFPINWSDLGEEPFGNLGFDFGGSTGSAAPNKG